MDDSLKNKGSNASGQVMSGAAKTDGKIGEGSKQSKGWAADKTGHGSSNASATAVKERMEVIASCGTRMGVVDHVEGSAIKLTKNDSPDGRHHFVPTEWIDYVDSSVHLKKNSEETQKGWKSDAASCGSCSG